MRVINFIYSGLIIFTILSISISCGENNTASTNDKVFTEPHINPIYFGTVCQGDSCSYIHYLILSTFKEECFNDYDFVYIADKYLDTVKKFLPVEAIQFCKPLEFKDIGGSENDEQLDKYAITLLWYNAESTKNKVPEISHISIWSDGKRKDLDYLFVSSRQQRMNYYNSKK